MTEGGATSVEFHERTAQSATGQEIARYDYDFERRRLSKLIQGVELDYSYAGSQVIAEYNGNQLINSYTLGANEVVKAELKDEGERLYYSDALGSVTSLSQNSSLTARNEYGSFGEIISNSGATNSSIGYTGQRLDVESGLMALGNGERYYSPELGRFIQQDSWTGMLATAQSMNRFAYGYNNPFKYRDPSGNVPTVVAGAIIGAVAGFVVNAAHQAVDIYNGDQTDGFHWGEALTSAGEGALVGAIIGTGVGALALLGYGAAATVGVTAGGVAVGATSFALNVQDGRYAHGTIDLAASLLPFANKGVRGSFGEFYGGGYSGTGVQTFKQNWNNLKGLPEVVQESRTSLETETKQLTDGGRGNQKQLGDGGVQERISTGKLLKAASEEQFPTYETPHKPLSRSQEQLIKTKVSERTATQKEYKNLDWNRRFNNRRQRGVDRFWAQEKRAVRDGKPTTRNYTESQKQELLNNQKPTFNGKSLEGHHRYNALDHPQIADKPWNIYPVTESEHLYRWHGRNFRNDTFGKPLDPNYLEEF